ncbi:PAS domain S-box protein, partial [bacterium]|nr:PAS domain S-box protein [bacterium]
LYFSEADRFRNYPAPGTDRTRVLRMKRRDGSEVWVEDNCRYIRDEHGEVAVHEGVLRDITERVRAEATLRESEERYRALAEALPDIVFVVDARGGIQYANALAASLVGLTPAQVRGRAIDEFFPEHINERQREQLARVFQSGETVHLELQTPLNGARRWLESWLVPMRDPGGRIGSVMGISRDITARKQTEQALLEDEERYRTALDSMLDAVHVVDRDLRIVLINAAFLEWLRRLGLDSDVVGRTIFEAFPFLPPAVGDEYRRVFETGGPTSTEETTEVGGSRLTTATRKIPVEIGGRVERVLTVIRDITERVQREQALRQLSVRQEALLSAIPDIVMEVDAAMVYRWANPAGIEFFGDDVLGREAAHYFEGEQQTYEAVRPLFDGDESVVYVESWQRRRDGEKRLLAWWSRVLKDDQGTVTGALSSARDITERRQAEERVKYLTYHDRLTGLANRACFEERIREYDRPEHHPLSLVMGDANGLKLVNDAFGHDAGDKFLQRLAAIIESCARPGDQVFRWGGDEFVVLMPRTGNDAARAVCDAIHRACGEAPEDPIQPSIALGAGTKASPDQPVNLMMMEAEDRMYRHKLVESKSLRSSIISSLGRTLWEADYETEEHALRLQALAREFGRSLKLTDSEMNDLMMLAALHDIGKIAIADGILLKPTVLSESEWEAVRKHPEIGFRIAQASPELAPIADGILHHHERWDGSGYPQGLQGERIPMIARILAIIDAYDVMTEKRLYKTTVSKEAAIAELERCAGSQFDPELVNLFVKIISRR